MELGWAYLFGIWSSQFTSKVCKKVHNKSKMTFFFTISPHRRFLFIIMSIDFWTHFSDQIQQQNQLTIDFRVWNLEYIDFLRFGILKSTPSIPKYKIIFPNLIRLRKLVIYTWYYQFIPTIYIYPHSPSFACY